MGGESWKSVTSAGRRVRRTGIPVLACILSLAVLPDVSTAQEAGEEKGALESQEKATHEVKRGDTLWDLAGVYLANPFLWPQIFEINTAVVEDPHWIYPGELLALPGNLVAQADGAAVETLETWDAAQDQGALPTDGDQGRGRVSWFGGTSVFDTNPEFGALVGSLDIETYGEPTLVSESDFYRAPLLIEGDPTVYQGRTVRKLEGNPLDLRLPAGIRQFDLVIIELDNLDVVEGDRLRAIRWEDAGPGRRVAHSIAMLDVLEADGQTARARVTGLFADYEVGDVVILAEGFDVPSTLGQAAEENGMQARLLGSERDRAILGEGDMVFLDAGDEDGVRIGDEFLLFDQRDDASTRSSDRMATMRVVRTTATTATGRIVDLRDTSPQPMSPARRVLRAVGN